MTFTYPKPTELDAVKDFIKHASKKTIPGKLQISQLCLEHDGHILPVFKISQTETLRGSMQKIPVHGLDLIELANLPQSAVSYFSAKSRWSITFQKMKVSYNTAGDLHSIMQGVEKDEPTGTEWGGEITVQDSR